MVLTLERFQTRATTGNRPADMSQRPTAGLAEARDRPRHICRDTSRDRRESLFPRDGPDARSCPETHGIRSSPPDVARRAAPARRRGGPRGRDRRAALRPRAPVPARPDRGPAARRGAGAPVPARGGATPGRGTGARPRHADAPRRARTHGLPVHRGLRPGAGGCSAGSWRACASRRRTRPGTPSARACCRRSSTRRREPGTRRAASPGSSARCWPGPTACSRPASSCRR